MTPHLALLFALFLLAAGCGPANPTHPLPQPNAARQASSSAPAMTPPPPAAIAVQEVDTLLHGAMGHRVVRTDKQDLVLLDRRGAFLISLGPMRGATFDRQGLFLYTWDSTSRALYDVTAAKKIASRLLSVQDFEGAGFTENSRRIIEVGEGIRFLSVPELTITFEVPGGHSELHQTAHRALTIRNVTPKKQDAQTELQLTLIDIDREKVIGTLPFNEAMVRIPQIAFSGNGQKMSLSLAGTRVWDTTINKVILLENGEFPEHDRYAPGPAYFSADGNSICVEQMGAKRTISITNVPKGTARHCFIVPREGRPWASEVSRADYSAKLVHIPVTPGMAQPPGMSGLYYRVTREALSPDERLAAVIEQSSKTGNSTNEAWLVIADMETGRVEHRVALPPISVELRQFDVRFTPDGRVVVVWYGDDEKGVAFDVQSGAPVGIPTNYKRPDE